VVPEPCEPTETPAEPAAINEAGADELVVETMTAEENIVKETADGDTPAEVTAVDDDASAEFAAVDDVTPVDVDDGPMVAVGEGDIVVELPEKVAAEEVLVESVEAGEMVATTEDFVADFEAVEPLDNEIAPEPVAPSVYLGADSEVAEPTNEEVAPEVAVTFEDLATDPEAVEPMEEAVAMPEVSDAAAIEGDTPAEDYAEEY